MSEKRVVGRCYDSAPHLDKMLRALIALVVLVLCAPPALGDTWRARAVPPKAGLPVVEVDLGYPGPYVATRSPIRLTARTGHQPFDGYIGFTLSVRSKGTMDTPVIARAVIGPNAAWTFDNRIHTWGWATRRNLANLEVTVVWRDRNRNVIAEQSAGRPPWSERRPLRVAGAGETVTNNTYLGEPAVVLPASALSAETQWYSGFSSVVVPAAVWFELPEPVREAVFRSGLHVHFFGVPPAMPRLSSIDEALLPIELQPGAGEVEVPWPYATTSQRVASPLTWRAKAGARRIGAASLPYLVAHDAAAFAASEDAFRGPLPGFAHRAPGWHAGQLRFHSSMPRPSEILREYRVHVVFALVALLCIAASLVIRKLRRPAAVVAAAVAVAATILIIAGREWIRPMEGSHLYTEITITTPGVAEIETRYRDYGRVPRVLVPAARTALSGGVTQGLTWSQAEVRDSKTEPGLGIMLGRVWGGAVRHASKRDLAPPVSLRVVSRNDKEIVVDYEADRPIDYIAAQWTLGNKHLGGEARTGSRSRGRVTVHDRHLITPSLWEFYRMTDGYFEKKENKIELGMTGATRVTLYDVARDRVTKIRHIDRSEDVAPAPPYRVAVPMHGDEEVVTAMLALPGAVPESAKATIALTQVDQRSLNRLKTMQIEGPGGAATIDISGVKLGLPKRISADDIRRVAPAGGIIRLTIDARGTGAAVSDAVAALNITKEKQ